MSGSWPLSENTPSAVAELLAESRRLFVGAAVCYDNFVASSLKALQAADLVLKLVLGFDPDEMRTMGQLLKFEQTHPALDSETREWYTEFALRFRNDLSTRNGPARSLGIRRTDPSDLSRACGDGVRPERELPVSSSSLRCRARGTKGVVMLDVRNRGFERLQMGLATFTDWLRPLRH